MEYSFNCVSCLLRVLGFFLFLPPDTLLCGSHEGLACVCVADKGKMSWSRGCRLCKRAGGSWWCSWRDWWSCSRWHTHTQIAYCSQHGVFSHTRGQSFSSSSHLLASVLAVTSLTFPLLFPHFPHNFTFSGSDCYLTSSFPSFSSPFVSDCPCCGPVGWGTATGSKFIPPYVGSQWCKCEIQH